MSISTDGGGTFTNKTTTNGLGSNTVKGVYASGSTVYAATTNAPLLLRFSGRINKIIDAFDSNYNVSFLKYGQNFDIRITDKQTRELLELKSSDYEGTDALSLEDFDTAVINFINRKEIARHEKIFLIISDQAKS